MAKARLPLTRADFDHLPGSGLLRIADHRRWPLVRLALYCGDCGWARDYNPEAVARRFRTLRPDGYQACVGDVARRVAWPCPACGHMKWAATLAYPKGLDPRERARAVRQLRS